MSKSVLQKSPPVTLQDESFISLDDYSKDQQVYEKLKMQQEEEEYEEDDDTPMKGR